MPFSGVGEHLLLLISKRDQNTTWITGLLAKLAGIRRQDIGFCGLKDRYAVTTQWFSLYLPGRDIEIDALVHDDFKIIESSRHRKKLRRGMHIGNRFCIELRDFSVSDDQLSERINVICDKGAPNYFGEQRFGRNGNNLSEAQKLVELDKLKGNKNFPWFIKALTASVTNSQKHPFRHLMPLRNVQIDPTTGKPFNETYREEHSFVANNLGKLIEYGILSNQLPIVKDIIEASASQAALTEATDNKLPKSKTSEKMKSSDSEIETISFPDILLRNSPLLSSNFNAFHSDGL